MADLAAEARIQSALIKLWANSLPRLQQQLAVLEQYAATASAGTVSHPLREKALSDAHKLAGILGTFGFPEGSAAANRLEAALSADLPLGDTSGADLDMLRKILRPGQ